MTENTDTRVQRVLLTPEEAAESLRISRTLVYDLMRTGRLESIRIASCRRVPVEAVAEFVERLRLSSTFDDREQTAQSPARDWDQRHTVDVASHAPTLASHPTGAR